MSSRVTEVMTTCERPSRSAASATRSGSSNSTVSVFPFGTLQNPHGRVQTLPRIMKVAVCWLQHSVRFGQRALSQTVWTPLSYNYQSALTQSEMTAGVHCAHFTMQQGGNARVGVEGPAFDPTADC